MTIGLSCYEITAIIKISVDYITSAGPFIAAHDIQPPCSQAREATSDNHLLGWISIITKILLEYSVNVAAPSTLYYNS